MSYYYFAILVLLLVPLVFYAYRMSSPSELSPTPQSSEGIKVDLTAGAFTGRTVAIVLGYCALYGIRGGNLTFILGQVLVPVIASVLLFALAYMVAKLLRRTVHAPRKKLFEFSLFVFALFAISIFLDMKMSQVSGT